MKPLKTRITTYVAATIGLAISTASAVNNFYAPGDLVLFFQKQGGDTVYANLGAATTFRGSAAGAADGVNQINFIDINATLISAFGNGWAGDTSVFAGLAGVFNTSNTQSTLNNGDPARTIYVSRSRSTSGTVGTADSAAWTGFGSTAMTEMSTRITTQNSAFADPTGSNGYNAAQIVSPASVSLIDDQNPLILISGQILQGTAFNNFGGGVSQQGTAGDLGVFGGAGTAEFNLDLYRILARATGGTGIGNTFVNGQVDGPHRTGSYEGTITVNSAGQVSFIAIGAAASAYDTWIGTFTTITAPADKLPTADPDNDGANNLEEFGFDGNPESGSNSGMGQVQTVDADGDTQKDISLTLAVRSGATFSASGNDLVSTVIDEVTYRIEGSTDLATWDSAVSEVSPQIGSGSPSSGYVFKTFRLNAGNGLNGKGFLRATVVK